MILVNYFNWPSALRTTLTGTLKLIARITSAPERSLVWPFPITLSLFSDNKLWSELILAGPCPFEAVEDKVELADGSAICVSKGGYKAGEAARKIELARKGLL